MQAAVAVNAAGALGVAVIALTATVFHWFAPVIVILCVCFILAIAASPFAALSGFLASVMVRPAEFFPQLQPLQLLKLLLLATVISWLIHSLLRRELRWVSIPHNKALGALVIACVLSCAASAAPATSLEMLTSGFAKVVVVYFLIVNIVDTQTRAVRLQVILAVVCSLLASYAVYAKLTGLASVEGERAGLVGLLADPNDLALVLLMVIPFLISAAIWCQGAQALFFSGLLIVTVAGILCTVSRGGLLGLAFGAYCVLRRRIRSRWTTAVLIVSATALLVLLSGVTERATVVAADGELDESALGRVDAWLAGLHMFVRNPILGVGFERFSENYNHYSVLGIFWRPHDAHNSFIKVLGETGILGFLPFLCFTALGARSAMRLGRFAESDDRGLECAFLRGMPANLGAFLVGALFLSQCWNWFFYIVIGQAAAAERIWASQRERGEASVVSAPSPLPVFAHGSRWQPMEVAGGERKV